MPRRRLDFPATRRNQEAIAGVLERFFEPNRELNILEIASGSGQHSAYFSRRFPLWRFQPSDLDPAHLESIEAYREEEGGENFVAPLRLDVMETPWVAPSGFDAILAINLIHISPWECTENLFAGARRHLASGGAVYLYGAFFRDGVTTAPSNLAFDESLRQRDARWGVRRLEDVETLATGHGFRLERLEEMPANNLSVLWRLS